VEGVLRVYRDQFWFFIKLVAPAVVVGYIAVLMGRNEGREIARQLLRVPISEIMRHRTEFVEIWLANSTGYLVSWMAFSFSFGAICFAVDQWWNGRTSGTVEPNKHWGPCHKRVPAVVIECAEAAILAAFLRHLRAGFVFSASG
jgi:hypothetical protein